ncbi:hypothetical protein [Nonomuraea wenchangensis]|uniref:Uncharacterized protein n=1 Tax=Nonomuraea wenchangensis TaxID=568860 RepID=A0A1I0KJZ2_9ACTN|nr:hypothetical protein [Nonomuraea wenchangensis]SEU24475.1 hypothetical protein SAMN05421811_108100 [Nonomuraea wenchangensis]
MDEFVPELMELETTLAGYRRAASLANAMLAHGWALMAEVTPTGPGRRTERDRWHVKVIAAPGAAGGVARRLRRAAAGGEVTVRALAEGLDDFLGELLGEPGRD